MKRQERARRSHPLGQVEYLETRALMTIAAVTPLPDMNVATGAAAAPVNLGSYFNDPSATPNFAIFDTTLGTIPVLLTPGTTPKTVANFQNYVNKGAYTNSVVHRSVPGFIWQAGGFQLSSKPDIAATPTDAPVQNEYGASNVRGTIAMAKLGSDPNSATSQFFFNESDANASNLNNQNGGFTVFGHVVGASGLAVMDAIAAVPVPSPGPMSSPLDSAPLQNYKTGAVVQSSNLILIKSVTTADEAFSAQSNAPGVASASLQGNNLIVTPLAAGTAKITVTGYGSDGVAATQTFSVTVSQGTPPVTTPPVTTPPGTTPPVTTPPVAQPASDLTPAARGALPASVVAGQKAKIQQTVTLTAASGPVTQREQVVLVLSTTTTGSPNDFMIAGAQKNIKLKAGKQAKLNLSAGRLDPSVPAGTYHVLVSVTDPDGAKTTIDTGRTLVVRAPQAKPVRR
ncbi:MAG: peptidylprolyl isomerase [Paludisphaera borealis]|uniref:peptidylprolyl isomerase n=1 Tax=Paludisphaera borealis TaxID=1387353 RepID=UPI0028523141|nr:peptidylprolyl isomerase [Paludisphaera borealis]MDR3621666.1 peptidylprolyl isomerase [Paludisphaera borealis]